MEKELEKGRRDELEVSGWNRVKWVEEMEEGGRWRKRVEKVMSGRKNEDKIQRINSEQRLTDSRHRFTTICHKIQKIQS